MPHQWDAGLPPPAQALRMLAEGNRRFRRAHGRLCFAKPFSPQKAFEAQRPFAIVLGCSDSRTPVEILFDQGFGDLFVVRVAGNVVGPSAVGSIEFAASQFGARLVVVMGHSRCGAIAATVAALRSGDGLPSRNIQAIANRIAPHLTPHLPVPPGEAPDMRLLTRAHVRACAQFLRHDSDILRELVAQGQLSVVGAEYELETGIVHFFDGAPALFASAHLPPPESVPEAA